MIVKKIAFYINTIVRNGAERAMTNLADQCVENGYQVIFITSYPVPVEYELRKEIKRYNLEKEFVPFALLFKTFLL